ncbi:hypothetical protein [Streptomyces sp. NRRL WC-3549]|uniref:hypothetical protein n=1 Tax=Streptomyces sp. NRRL WC-3549 TaxID=1463925 RepID=UPI0004CB34D3|nr:hypothetical protein [Streptomyces sp. NRRL WC-3549]
MREEAGDRDGAERLYQQMADARSGAALPLLADLREEADRNGAERLYRQAADAGNADALLRLARVIATSHVSLRAAGEILRYGWEPDGSVSPAGWE